MTTPTEESPNLECRPASHWYAMYNMAKALRYNGDHVQELYNHWQKALEEESQNPLPAKPTPLTKPTSEPPTKPTITLTAKPTITPTAKPTITPTAKPTLEKWENKKPVLNIKPVKKTGSKPRRRFGRFRNRRRM